MHNFLSKIKLFILKALGKVFFLLLWIFPIDKNKIFCSHFNGLGIADSPKYIIEELLKRKKYKIIWAVSNPNNLSPNENINYVKIKSLKYFYHLATSKIIINTCRFPVYIYKRKKQLYIQTWHGSLMLKKIEFDVSEKLGLSYIESMNHDNKLIDVMISNSDFTSNVYRKSFKYNGKILKYGIPRNDVLINDVSTLKSKVHEYYKIPIENKILLYAPTFRDDYTNNPYHIDLKNIVSILEKKTKCKWTLMLKKHPKLTSFKGLIYDDYEYINADDYNDTQELLCACDILITDYSSMMFDALIASKPVLLFANDIDSYVDERGFYFKFDELPFPLSTSNDELCKIVKDYDANKILKQYEKFNKKVGLIDDGKASIKIVNYIEKYIKEYK